MDDGHAGGRRERPIDGGHGVCPAPYIQDQVCLVHYAVGVWTGSVSPHDADAEGVILRDASLPVDGSAHGHSKRLGKRGDVVPGLGDDGSPTGDHHRALCVPEQLCGALHRRGIGSCPVRGVGLVPVLGVEREGANFFVQDVVGDGDLHRSGATAGGDAKRSGDGFWCLFGSLDARSPLGHWRKECFLVQLRQNPSVVTRKRRVAGEDDEWYGRRLGFGDTGQDVGGARSARPLADSWFVAESGVDIGHKRC